MQLVRLVYASQKTSSFSPHDLEDVLACSKAFNERQHITGVLCFNRKFFLQCLEGSRKSVNELYNKIVNDERHSNVMLLHYEEISERFFSRWMMSFVPENHLHESLILRFSIDQVFDPYRMNAKSCLALLMYVNDKVVNNDPDWISYVDISASSSE